MDDRMNPFSRGRRAERAAAQHLRRAGCRLVARNYTIRGGEIDLIVIDQEELVFVEVRYRKDALRGDGADSVTRSKLQRIIRTAEHFLATHPLHAARVCRFDVMSLDDSGVHWLQRAFTHDDLA